MKTISQPAVVTPGILVLALLFAIVTFIGVTGKKVPLLSSIRLDILLLVIIGMLFGYFIAWQIRELRLFYGGPAELNGFFEQWGLTAMFGATLDYQYNWMAVFIWLGIVVVISILASIFPARGATRISVRDSLAYA